MGKWHKAPGDEMVEGDVVCDIQTDKAVMAMEASEEGVLAKLLIEENTTVKVNTLIALLAEDGEDWKQVAASGVSAESSAASPAPAAAAEAAPLALRSTCPASAPPWRRAPLSNGTRLRVRPLLLEMSSVTSRLTRLSCRWKLTTMELLQKLSWKKVLGPRWAL